MHCVVGQKIITCNVVLIHLYLLVQIVQQQLTNTCMIDMPFNTENILIYSRKYAK